MTGCGKRYHGCRVQHLRLLNDHIIWTKRRVYRTRPMTIVFRAITRNTEDIFKFMSMQNSVKALTEDHDRAEKNRTVNVLSLCLNRRFGAFCSRERKLEYTIPEPQSSIMVFKIHYLASQRSERIAKFYASTPGLAGLVLQYLNCSNRQGVRIP